MLSFLHGLVFLFNSDPVGVIGVFEMDIVWGAEFLLIMASDWLGRGLWKHLQGVLGLHRGKLEYRSATMSLVLLLFYAAALGSGTPLPLSYIKSGFFLKYLHCLDLTTFVFDSYGHQQSSRNYVSRAPSYARHLIKSCRVLFMALNSYPLRTPSLDTRAKSPSGTQSK